MSGIVGHLLGGSIGAVKIPVVSVLVALDLTCPFSKRAWDTLVNVSFKYDRDQVQIRKLDWVQLWHPQGYILALAGAAVKKATGSDVVWFKFTSWLYEHQGEFLDEPMYKLTREQLENRLADAAHELVEVDRAVFKKCLADDKTIRIIKDHTKFGRQNGIHESPTFFINGVVVSSVNSSWTVNQWTGLIDNYLAALAPSNP